MPPDFLLRCTVCGGESVWDTDACPPVGTPQIGHPILWRCEACGEERRHIIENLFLALDKLHHEICVATEIDRLTVDLVMTELYWCRRAREPRASFTRMESAEEAEEVARVTGIRQELVEQIAMAEAAWLLRRGYVPKAAKGE